MDDDYGNLVEGKIASGNELISFLSQLSHIEGLSKLSRKVKAELKFLNRLTGECSQLKKDHLRSSNLDNLQAICDVVKHNRDHVISVLTSFRRREASRRAALVVDVVMEGGGLWCKVVSRNAAALHRVSVGYGDFGQRSIVDQARNYMRHASENLHFFRAPRVRFVFSAGVGRSVRDRLTAVGVEVTGEVIDDHQLGISIGDDDESDDSLSDSSPTRDNTREDPDCRQSSAVQIASSNQLSNESSTGGTLNLDVTAMLAYVSNLTNGGSQCHFRQPLLRQQAAWERQWPVKCQLDLLFEGRRLICCRSAEQAFRSIVTTVGGPTERSRAQALLDRVQVLDDPQCEILPPERRHCSGKFNERSTAIFGLGESEQVPTVTANSGFIRAAASHGVRLTVITHGSRALSEAKQLSCAADNAVGDVNEEQEADLLNSDREGDKSETVSSGS